MLVRFYYLMLKILLIDDDSSLIQDMLELFGYDVDVADNGKLGLEMLKDSFKYDLVILDLVMPNIDGWGVLQKIRKDPECSTIPVLILSSCKGNKSIVAGLRRGADAYLEKPIEPHVLMANIEAMHRRSNWGKSTLPLKSLDSSKYELLTAREREVLKEIAKGHKNEDIASNLCISSLTVKNHVVNILKKLEVSNRTEAAVALKDAIFSS